MGFAKCPFQGKPMMRVLQALALPAGSLNKNNQIGFITH
jgi:hypothetical protein